MKLEDFKTRLNKIKFAYRTSAEALEGSSDPMLMSPPTEDILSLVENGKAELFKHIEEYWPKFHQALIEHTEELLLVQLGPVKTEGFVFELPQALRWAVQCNDRLVLLDGSSTVFRFDRIDGDVARRSKGKYPKSFENFHRHFSSLEFFGEEIYAGPRHIQSFGDGNLRVETAISQEGADNEYFQQYLQHRVSESMRMLMSLDSGDKVMLDECDPERSLYYVPRGDWSKMKKIDNPDEKIDQFLANCITNTNEWIELERGGRSEVMNF